MQQIAPPSPGIGVELEVSQIVLRNEKGATSTPEELVRIKGAVISNAQDKVVGWRRTAETTGKSNIERLTVEWIIDGLVVKLGVKVAGVSMARKAAEEVVKDLNKFRPQDGVKVSIAGFEQKYGDWTVINPRQFVESAIMFAQQVTVPLPLESIPDFAGMSRNPDEFPPNYFVSSVGVTAKKARMHMVQKGHFAGSDPVLSKVNSNDMKLLGFLSLVLAYSKNSDSGYTKGESPKLINFLMPRTNFLAMYLMVSASLNGQNLYNVVKALAQFRGDGTNDKDSAWTGNRLDTQVFFFENGDLKVPDWINGLSRSSGASDLLAEKDKQVDGQIGSLGSKTEAILGNPNKGIPIFELRDLGSSGTARLADNTERFESTAIEIHRKWANA